MLKNKSWLENLGNLFSLQNLDNRPLWRGGYLSNFCTDVLYRNDNIIHHSWLVYCKDWMRYCMEIFFMIKYTVIAIEIALALHL